MGRVAVFVSRYGIGNSPSIINFLDFISDHYEVDLYVRDVDMLDAPVLKKREINLVPIRRRHILAQKIRNTVFRPDTYEHYICFNPNAFVMCKEMFPHSRPIYYSLELYMSYDNEGLYYPPEVRRKERAWINDIKGLIIQSREKEMLFREDYDLSDGIPTFYLPVTYRGKSSSEKSSYLRDKYGIDANKKVVLQLGEIKWWFHCVEIARVFSGVRDWFLVFHGYYDWEYLEKLRTIIREESIENVIVSTEVFGSIDDLDELIMSCDAGIAWYSDFSVGLRNVGRSSGKISAYLRFGLPAVTNSYPTLVSAVQDTGCGLCLDGFEQIPEALSKIEENYSEYSKNAIAEYDKSYWFEKYKDGLLNFLNAKSESCCGVC